VKKLKQTKGYTMKKNLIDNFKLVLLNDYKSIYKDYSDKDLNRLSEYLLKYYLDSELKTLLNKLDIDKNLNDNDLEKTALLFALKLSK
tara:strand:- start:117 stop:380 length:264 start_codon:yes stop_codon:yes gene_type:complete